MPHLLLKNAATSWSSPGLAAYDFRSDYVTVPTAAMLQSIQDTTLGDDVMMEDNTTNDFQEFIAELTGKDSALFMLSGTMGNQVAIRAGLGAPPYSIVVDERSHLVRMEVGGAATLCSALVHGVMPANRHHLTLDDIRKKAVLGSGIYDCPTRMICLENTLAGTVMPLKDVQAIGEWARSQCPPIHVHVDGARLWEAVAAGAGSLQQFCGAVDSVSLCLTKGLGAPIGSVLVGSSGFIERARMVRKLYGGGIRAAGVLTAPARVAIEDVFLGGRLRAAQEAAALISSVWVSKGGKLLHPTETNMVWLDLPHEAAQREKLFELIESSGLKIMRGMLEGRIVVHYQICEDAIRRLCQAMEVFFTAF